MADGAKLIPAHFTRVMKNKKLTLQKKGK